MKRINLNELRLALLWKKYKPASRLKKIALSIFLCFSIFVALLSSLMATEFGSHWAVRTLAHMAKVQVGALQGNLIAGLDIATLDFTQHEFSLHAEKISFRWQPLGLFYSALSVQSLSAENINIQLPPSKPASENSPWPTLALPLRVHLQQFKLRNIHLQQGDTHIPIEVLQGNLSWGTFHARSSELTLKNDDVNLTLKGSIGLAYPYEMNLASQWSFKRGANASDHYAGHFKLTGDLKTLTLEHQLEQPAALAARAIIAPALRQAKAQPKAELSFSWPEQVLLPEWAAALGLNSALPAQAAPQLTQGELKLSGWLNDFALNSHIHLQAFNQKLELIGAAQAQFNAEKKSLTSNIASLNVRTKALGVTDQGENSIHLNGTIAGNFGAEKNWQWQLNTRTEHFNLIHFLADWPSDIQLAFKAQGEFNPRLKTANNSGLSLGFSAINGQGDLRGLSVSARGDVHYDGSSWRSSDATLAIGANQVTLKGQAGKALALTWNINAPLLGQIDPQLRGSIVSSGSISDSNLGTGSKVGAADKAHPRINIVAQVEQFAWRDYALGSLSLALTPQAASNNYDLQLSAAQVQVQTQRLTQLELKGEGSLAQHRVSGSLVSPNVGAASFSLDSGWQDQLWRGQWRELVLDVKKVPRWHLASATPMQLSINKISNSNKTTSTNKPKSANNAKVALDLGRVCLTSAPAAHAQREAETDTTPERPDICLASAWNTTQGLQLDATLTALPINQFQAWFKAEVIAQGVLDGKLVLRAPPSKPLALEAYLQTRDAQFLYQFQGGEIKAYPLNNGRVEASINNHQLTAKLAVDWAQYGVVNGSAHYQFKDKKIQGKLSAELNDLAPLESLLPFLNKVSGAARADLSVAGSATKPEVTGTLSLSNGGANLPRLGVVLRDFDLKILSQGAGKLHMDAQVTSGEGTLMVKGDLENLGTPQWAWQSNIYGANIRFVEQPQLIATLSPNLKLSANANAINLTGSTEIPWARAALKTLPASATRVSADVRVLENEQAQQNNMQSKSAIPFFTNVILYFGDDVRFKGFGLDTQLLGKVNVLKEEQRQTFVTGFVAVGKGNYKAYGQDLVIERGRLIFQGPYDNPGLDIRALRIMDDATAGLEIGGTLQHPKSSVFAIPARSSSEAMAMLLTGKPLSQSSQADAYSLLGAIGSLGMDRGHLMTSDISSKFRIDELTIKSDKGFDQSELWMGKYVTPKLFIRYMVGLFDQAFALGMRYEINDKLRLEAESGKTQSVDMIYKIER